MRPQAQWRRSRAGILVPGGDPYWDNVLALLHFNGTDGSTALTDEKGNTWTAQANGQLDTDNPKFGTAAFLSDGTGDGAFTNKSSAYDLIGDDFTIECWADPDDLPGRWIMGSRGVVSDFNNTNGIHVLFNMNGSGFLKAQFSSGAATPYVATSTLSVSTGSYQFFSLSYVASTNKAYIGLDGTIQEITLDGTPVRPSGNPALFVGGNLIEGNTTSNNVFDGHIDEARFTVGVARYKENFTPPSEPFPNS